MLSFVLISQWKCIAQQLFTYSQVPLTAVTKTNFHHYYFNKECDWWSSLNGKSLLYCLLGCLCCCRHCFGSVWIFLRRQRGEKGIGFVSHTYLQEAFGCFPGEAVIFWKSYLLPFSILFAGQSIKWSIFFQALFEHLMNCYGSLRTRVIYSQPDSAIGKGSPQRSWEEKYYHQGILWVKNTVWLHTTRQRGLEKNCRTKHNSGTSYILREGLSKFKTIKHAMKKEKVLFLTLCSVSWIKVHSIDDNATSTLPIPEESVCPCSVLYNSLSFELTEEPVN